MKDKPPAVELPVQQVLAPLLGVLRRCGVAVLQAPPGAGKTTLVPLAMLDDGLVAGRILMLEPRRLAARAAAERMAALVGEAVGGRVGYRMRGESRISSRTRVEVVTEGILTRMIQADPALEGIGAVIFDEFHERSLNADTGLALVWEARQLLRPDLVVLVMSATLDAAALAAMLGAEVITSAGQVFPIRTHYLDRPMRREDRFETAAAALIATAAAAHPGGVLAFLPGAPEIRRVAQALAGRTGPGDLVLPLHGAMDFAAQRAAIQPAGKARKIVLATAIAETSLTIEDVGVVVDCGRARRARFDPASGLSRLVTERVTRAEADQRRGRAGRLGPGACYRMWTEGEEGGLAAFAPPEIAAADLTGLALELALWGNPDGAGLAFLTPPPAPALAEARALLEGLGGMGADGRITDHGRALAALPLHPRLAHMLLCGGSGAASLAALLSERDPLGPGEGSDLDLRRRALDRPGSAPAAARPALERIRREAQRLAAMLPAGTATPRATGWAACAALAYPDRIAQRRPGSAPRWLLSGGKGATMPAGDALAGAPFLVVTDLDGDPREARIRQAIPITESEIRALFADRIHWQDSCAWSRRERRVVARRQQVFGALVLAERPWTEAAPEAVAAAMLEGFADLAPPMGAALERLAARIEMARQAGAALPAADVASLRATAGDWLLPRLAIARTAADLETLDYAAALRESLGHAAMAQVDRLVPPDFVTPLGRRAAIDYSGGVPAIALRLQELFGQRDHPRVGGMAIQITLLSPAGRPLQITTDLPGFWQSSYADVRKDMRGQYPRHPWPEDPAKAEPTLRAKPRKR